MYLDPNGQPATMAMRQHLNLNGENGNYSKPASVHCCVNSSRGMTNESNCTCHKVMSWADNWIPCKRGNGIENTGVIVSKVNPSTPNGIQVIAEEPSRCKLNAENGKVSLYALVDPGKKNQSKRIIEEMQQPAYEELRCTSDAVNANYANLSFEKSLENYENVREVLRRERALSSNSQSNDNYIVMESKANVPDYIPMQPVPPPPEKDYEIVEEKSVGEVEVPLRKSRSLNDLKRSNECLEMKKSPSCNILFDIKREVEFHVEASAVIYENVGSNRTAIVQSIEQELKEEHVYTECDSTAANRDSSGSNDSGVSASSSTIRNKIIERPALSIKTKRRLQMNQQVKTCVHASLIRKSRSFDPFGDSIQFQFNSTMNNRTVMCNNNFAHNQSNKCPSLGAIMTGNIDSNSTSSGTSDMSDYIETLSLSSYSSTDADALR